MLNDKDKIRMTKAEKDFKTISSYFRVRKRD